ncbi:MAG: monovalent cation/H(+) antiporter subunit G [Spirochaetes bacterium]|jgi:multicomponent Na+:H+ antiporter subunit G|nr:monovalent cation/H(+) antiporter subunit G [Spirochaetota bacterium]MBP8986598.1 monovalent cation/H(+) antiporter subunit G [Spirochaetota bacterium]HOE20797.1 monovalent cation/H(+) antiporter subunit G [Spirochaetota bacterium]HQL43064.1 monovalent cation/H(+) antiporter subunit G [Spirochaetota bacterium]HQQ50534.1 monovalent cation/H(+) antiporter subunit G [Spirochaetota bacterium]
MDIIICIFLAIGLLVNGISIVGLMRFPDIYTRLHAATKTTTFGSIFVVLAVGVKNIWYYDATSITIIIHSIVALLVIIFTNPISAHAIARASLLSGIKPFGVVINEYDYKSQTKTVDDLEMDKISEGIPDEEGTI